MEANGLCSGSELAQVMVEVLVHQDGPLIRGEAAKEAVRIGGAALGSCGGEAIDQSEESQTLRLQVAMVVNQQALRSGRVGTHRLVVAKDEWFDEHAENPAGVHAVGHAISHGPLHAGGTMRDGLRDGHAAPLPLAVRMQPGQAIFHFLRGGGFVQILHARNLTFRDRSSGDEFVSMSSLYEIPSQAVTKAIAAAALD